MTNPDLPLSDIGFDYLEDAKAALEQASVQLSKVVAPGVETLLSAAMVNALVCIAESLEAMSYLDIELYPTDKDRTET